MGQHRWTIPEKMAVYFCSVCHEQIGILDVDRIRHEHFEQGWPKPTCTHGVFYVVEYAKTGREGRGILPKDVAA